MLILNDIHIGVQRQAGTTPKSQEALREYLFDSFEKAIAGTNEHRLCILGDLFDEFEVAPRDWIRTYMILSSWLRESNRLVLVAGNHDHSPKAHRVSSYQMLCDVLKNEYFERVVVVDIDQWRNLGKSVIALAHCSNQDFFDMKLAEVLEDVQPGTHVLLHANWDNNFAVHSDHSLNVSREQGEAFAAKGATLVFAHEHQAKNALGGKVQVLGNQWPTSIADCLGNSRKHAHILRDGLLSQLVTAPTWTTDSCDAGFVVVDWRELDLIGVVAGFVRVEGTASSNEASDVINAIAALRQRSEAFVISNAVKIDGIVEAEALPQSFEVAKRFDVIQYIEQHLEPAEVAAVRELMGQA